MTDISITPANSDALPAGWGVHAPPGRVYPPVAESLALIEPFLQRCKEQEDMYVAAGFPLEGITEFWRKWFAAWNDDSPEALEDSWDPDLVWTISNFGQLEFRDRDETIEIARFGYIFVREMRFCPWDGTDTNLPYYDFFNGQVRAALPYCGSINFVWSRVIPWPRKPIRGCGVDRYILRKEAGEWKIVRIDTDQDMFPVLIQLLPFAYGTTRLLTWLVRTLPVVGRKLSLYDREYLYSRQYVASRRARNLPHRKK
ncbi:Uncharacterised protein [Mycobacteroides abscessus subsp. abscessus]|nr:Uncharacterised protein [Mycobacteroides abscessus subsp. abscessus]